MYHFSPIPFYGSLLLLIIGLIILIFPPKFGSSFMALKTKPATANENNWKKGQKLNALLYIFLGVFMLIYSLLAIKEHGFIWVLVYIGLYGAGMALINKILQKKSNSN